MPLIDVGSSAPDFTAVAHDGRRFSLADLRGQNVVIFFYPRDGTPVCTAEACAFRDSFHDFEVTGAVVVGISGDSAEKHRAFAAEHQLPYPLISDHDGAIRKAFGVTRTLGILPERVTFVIDKQGMVRMRYSSQLSAARHVEEARRVVQQLVGE